MFKIISCAFVLLLLSGESGFLFAQSQEKKYAVMMVNFAKGMQWPAASATGNFVIGIYEYPPLASELAAYTSSIKLGARAIEIKEIAAPDEIQRCHMLFVPAYKTKRLPEILTAANDKPILIISNKMDYARKGAGINFVLVDGMLKYEINSKAIEKRGVKISANLKGMGIAVE